MATQQERSASSIAATRPAVLAGIRVDRARATSRREYCGLSLAGLGADVIKIEPPGGNPTRRIGPFYEDKAGSRALALLLALQPRQALGRARPERRKPTASAFARSLASADVLLESTPRGELDRSALEHASSCCNSIPRSIVARVSRRSAITARGPTSRAPTSSISRSAA